MKAATSWTTYRTRFLVKAKQLATDFTFTDSLGRQHSGRKGDYLVEFSGGILRIASRQIFEDIYVPITPDLSQPTTPGNTAMPLLRNSSDLKSRDFSYAAIETEIGIGALTQGVCT